MILAHGTSVDAPGCFFAEGIVPGHGLRKGGRDAVHVLPIETPANVGGRPLTELQGIDFVGLSDKSKGGAQVSSWFLSKLKSPLAKELSL